MIFINIVKYLKYIFLSGHRKGHGIHSPFVFAIVSHVFRNKIDPDIVCKIEKIREKMITDKRTIDVVDLGAGSVRFKTNLRKVSDIARYSPVNKKYGALLYNLAAEFGNSMIVEFGTSLGISTMYLAAGCPGATVKTMEASASVSDIAVQNFREAGMRNIEVLSGSFEEVLPVIENSGIKSGLVFIDGNHRKEPVIEYFNRMADISDNNTVIVLDDINYSVEMGEAWTHIKNSEKVSVTIDIFRMGIVFFREGINHNDYIIRY